MLPCSSSRSGGCLARENSAGGTQGGALLSPINPKLISVPLPQGASCQECQHHGHRATAHSHSPKPAVSQDRRALGTRCFLTCWGDTKAGAGTRRDRALLRKNPGGSSGRLSEGSEG